MRALSAVNWSIFTSLDELYGCVLAGNTAPSGIEETEPKILKSTAAFDRQELATGVFLSGMTPSTPCTSQRHQQQEKAIPISYRMNKSGQVSAAAHSYTLPRRLNGERREISPIKRRESDLKSMFGKIKVCGDSC